MADFVALDDVVNQILFRPAQVLGPPPVVFRSSRFFARFFGQYRGRVFIGRHFCEF